MIHAQRRHRVTPVADAAEIETAVEPFAGDHRLLRCHRRVAVAEHRQQIAFPLSLGVDVARYKLYALIASAAITTLCGTFYAQYVLYVEPMSTVSLVVSLEICFIAILGGIGTLWGPALGAFVIVPLTEMLRAYLSGRISLDMSALSEGGFMAWLEYYARGGGGNLDILAYGLVIILIARFQPAGVLGFLRRID